MSFEAFDQKTLEEFQQEAQARWGQTEAYQTFEAKGETAFPAVTKEMMEIMQAFGALRHGEASAQEAQDQVKVLQDYISEHFYPCNRTILAGLGQMYTEDNRFTTFIDQAGGTGTATFVAKAISIYCQP